MSVQKDGPMGLDLTNQLKHPRVKGWPICDKCNKPVDAVEEVYVPHLFSAVIRVVCHGDFEEASLTDYTLAESQGVRYERAFIQPKLIGGEP